MSGMGFDGGDSDELLDDARLIMGESAGLLVETLGQVQRSSQARKQAARELLLSISEQGRERSRDRIESARQLADGLSLLTGSTVGEDPALLTPPSEPDFRRCNPDSQIVFAGASSAYSDEAPDACEITARFEPISSIARIEIFRVASEEGWVFQVPLGATSYSAIFVDPFARSGARYRWESFCRNDAAGTVQSFATGQFETLACSRPPEDPQPPDEPEPPSQPPECPKCEQVVCCCAPVSPPEPPVPPLDYRWQVWRRATGPRDCYVISNREDPESDQDSLLKETMQQETARQWAESHCLDDETEDPDRPTEEPVFPSGSKFLGGCNWEQYFAILQAGSQPPNIAEFPLDELKRIFASLGRGSGLLTGTLSSSLWGRALQVLLDSVSVFVPQLLDGLAQWSSSGGCGSKQFFDAKTVVIILDTLEKWVGTDLNPWGQQIRYIVNGICPYIQPGAADAIQGWLNGSLTVERLKTLLSINAICYDDWIELINGQRTKLAPGQLVDALYRKIIDEPTFIRELRSSGFLEDKDYKTLIELGKYIAPPTDLIRFMVRDVEDPKIVEGFGLDSDYEAKYQGLSRELGEKQGVDDDTMRRYWRAHWTIPSPTQLYEMYHRLRNEPDESKKVTLETVETALQQQDILPFWIPRLLEISFSPLTRVDTRRAYDLGDIDEAEVRKSYAAQGYSDENIEILTKFSRTLKVEGIDNQRPLMLYKQGLEEEGTVIAKLTERGFSDDEIGAAIGRVHDHHLRNAHSLRPYKQYTDGLLDETEFRDELRFRRYNPLVVDEIVRQANREISRQSRKKCIDAVRTRFFFGELTESEARDELVSLGVPTLVAQERAEEFSCELVRQEKQGTLREFRQWLEFGTATPAEIEERLRKLRYSAESARKIVAAMLERLRQEQQKQIAQERRQLETELKKQEKERKRTEKESQSLLERARKAAAASKDAAEKRALTIEKAAITYANKFDADLDVTQDRLQALRLYVRRTTQLNRDREVEAVVRAVEAATKLGNPDLEGLAESIADSIDSWLDSQA